jgi:type I restriction enzyme R subunit
VSGAIAESHLEEAVLAWLEELGFTVAGGLDIGPDGATSERAAYDDVLLAQRVRAAIARLNPHLTADVREEVFRKLTIAETPILAHENRRLHCHLADGVPVEIARPEAALPASNCRRTRNRRLTPRSLSSQKTTPSTSRNG